MALPRQQCPCFNSFAILPPFSALYCTGVALLSGVLQVIFQQLNYFSNVGIKNEIALKNLDTFLLKI